MYCCALPSTGWRVTSIVWSLTFITTESTLPFTTSLVKLGWTSLAAGGATVPWVTTTSGWSEPICSSSACASVISST